MQKMPSTRMIVDRIEGSIAVCEQADKTFIDIPLSNLPKGIKEGSVLLNKNGSWKIDAEEQDERNKRIEKKMNSLFID